MSTSQLAVDPATTAKEEIVRKRAITAKEALNEAYDYPRPSSFSRGFRIDIKGVTILLISGTASIDEYGKTLHEGDFRAQTLRTYQNITALLASEGATWKDVVRTTCYLRDIDRDYFMTAGEAKEYGLIDDILAPRRGISMEALEVAGRLASATAAT